MEKSRASWQLRQALRRRTRKWRRRQVVSFYVFMFIWMLISLGRDHHSWYRFFWAVYPVVMAWGAGTQWFRIQRRIVGSLDDWAQVRHGLNFDQLAEAEQKEILRKKLLGFRRVLDSEWNTDGMRKIPHTGSCRRHCRGLWLGIGRSI
jgi:hypothetical protein